MNDMSYITTINNEKINYNHDIDLLLDYDLTCSRYNFGAGSTFNYDENNICSFRILEYGVVIEPCKKQVGNKQYIVTLTHRGGSSRIEYKLIVRSKTHAEIIARKYLVMKFNHIASTLQISMREYKQQH